MLRSGSRSSDPAGDRFNDPSRVHRIDAHSFGRRRR
jgi:hypothetical protein